LIDKEDEVNFGDDQNPNLVQLHNNNTIKDSDLTTLILPLTMPADAAFVAVH